MNKDPRSWSALYPRSSWWADHSISHMHYDQLTHVIGFKSRLAWKIRWSSP
jgi:hypothetical protein